MLHAQRVEVFMLDCKLLIFTRSCMRKMRFCLASMTAFMVAMAVPPASAAGFGAAGSGAVLGQGLDFAVPLHLDPAEQLAPECVSAEVTFGERRLPPPLVRTVLEPQGAGSVRVRVLTTQAVDEPLIGVELSVGCPSRLSRSYVVLADPPGIALLATAAVMSAPAFAHAPARAELAEETPPSTAGRALQRAAATAAARALPRTQPRVAPPRRPRATLRRPVRRAAAVAVPARLTLEVAAVTPSVEAATVESALQAVAQAASAARASAAAVSAAAARIATLESTAERLGKEARASRDEAAQLREQLSRINDAARWTLPLLGLVLLLAALTAWLAWRLAGQQRQRQRGWIDAALQPGAADSQAQPTPSRPPTSPIPFVTSVLPAAAGLRARGAAAWPPAAPAEPWAASGTSPQPRAPVEAPPDAATARTEVLPAPAVRLGDSSPRDVSIDELIDLEQQAEFFVVLGQDEAAIDLLVQHLRDTGGGSPLPYLKLLEIQHRRADREAYERTRARFNHRFNAYAPEWGQDMRAGRSLEDYPGLLPRLQQVWPRPLDAMAELEALLFRKSRGELFDLPAYREVLFLYALARDLLDREPVDPNNVDLLLPLADGGEFSTTAPVPLAGQHNDGAAANAGLDDRPTAPVDLDLTQAAPTASIFDPQGLAAAAPRP